MPWYFRTGVFFFKHNSHCRTHNASPLNFIQLNYGLAQPKQISLFLILKLSFFVASSVILRVPLSLSLYTAYTHNRSIFPVFTPTKKKIEEEEEEDESIKADKSEAAGI